RARYEHALPAGEPRRHPDRVAGGAPPAVHGKADEVELEQLSELAAELEPHLVAAVVGGRRPPDGSHELAPADDLVAHRRHVVLPATCAEEAEVLLARLVARERLAEVTRELDLGDECRRQVELAAEAVPRGDLREELGDALRPDGVEHLLL